MRARKSGESHSQDWPAWSPWPGTHKGLPQIQGADWVAFSKATFLGHPSVWCLMSPVPVLFVTGSQGAQASLKLTS